MKRLSAQRQIYGAYLRAEREQGGLSLGDVSRATGLAVSRVSSIELGYAPEPTDEERAAIWPVITAYRADDEG